MMMMTNLIENRRTRRVSSPFTFALNILKNMHNVYNKYRCKNWKCQLQLSTRCSFLKGWKGNKFARAARHCHFMLDLLIGRTALISREIRRHMRCYSAIPLRHLSVRSRRCLAMCNVIAFSLSHARIQRTPCTAGLAVLLRGWTNWNSWLRADHLAICAPSLHATYRRRVVLHHDQECLHSSSHRPL